MTKKILELTEKIYNEGIEKAKDEGKLIIAKAKKEADTIIASAKNKEKEIIEQAQKQADELKKNTDSELRLTSRQFISVLKQKITSLIITEQTKKPIKESFKDDDFIKQIVITTVKNWNPKNTEQVDLKLLLPPAQEKNIKDFFSEKSKDILNSGLEINFDSNIKNGFKIGPKDGSYHISFTDEVFENYFKTYLKSKTKKMLFE